MIRNEGKIKFVLDVFQIYGQIHTFIRDKVNALAFSKEGKKKNK